MSEYPAKNPAALGFRPNRRALLDASIPRFPQDASSELKPYQPDTRETISNWVYDKARRYGLPANQYRKKTSFLLDFIPGLGDYLGAEDAVNDYQNGQYLKSAIGGGLTALGVVAGPAKGLVKHTKSKADEAIDALERELFESDIAQEQYAKKMQPIWDAEAKAKEQQAQPYLQYAQSGLWRKNDADKVISRIGTDVWGLRDAVKRANLNGIKRVLIKQGWSVRHTSKERGRISSHYLVSPDGKFEIRMSDHALPDTPQREYSRQHKAARWNDELVIDGTETPNSILQQIQESYDNFSQEMVR